MTYSRSMILTHIVLSNLLLHVLYCTYLVLYLLPEPTRMIRLFRMHPILVFLILSLIYIGSSRHYSTELQPFTMHLVDGSNRMQTGIYKNVRLANFFFLILRFITITFLYTRCSVSKHKTIQKTPSTPLQMKPRQECADSLQLVKTSKLITDFTQMSPDHCVFPVKTITMMMYSTIFARNDYAEDDLETDGATESHVDPKGHLRPHSCTKQAPNHTATTTQGAKTNNTENLPIKRHRCDNDQFSSASLLPDSSEYTPNSDDHPSLEGVEWVKAFCNSGKSAREEHEESVNAWKAVHLKGKQFLSISNHMFLLVHWLYKYAYNYTSHARVGKMSANSNNFQVFSLELCKQCNMIN